VNQGYSYKVVDWLIAWLVCWLAGGFTDCWRGQVLTHLEGIEEEAARKPFCFSTREEQDNLLVTVMRHTNDVRFAY
jgi:hypothetical protein